MTYDDDDYGGANHPMNKYLTAGMATMAGAGSWEAIDQFMASGDEISLLIGGGSAVAAAGLGAVAYLQHSQTQD